MDARRARRGAAARRVVEGVQRPGARRAGRARQPAATPASRRRGAPRAGARLGARDRCRSLAAGRRRRERPARAGHHRRRRRAGAQPVHRRRRSLLRGRPVRAAVARQRGREARRAGAGGLLQSARLLVQAERRADLSRAARARRRKSAGEKHAGLRIARRSASPSAAGAPATSPSSTSRARAPRCPPPSRRRWRSTGAAPSWRTRSPCCWARCRRNFSLQDRGMEDRAAGRFPAGVPSTVLTRRPGCRRRRRTRCSPRSRASASPRRRGSPTSR